MIQVVSILLAMAAGALCKDVKISSEFLNRILMGAVFFILFIMGYSFGSHAENLWIELLQLSKTVGLISGLLFLCNSIGVYAGLKLCKLTITQANERQNNSIFPYLLISSKYLVCVIAGVLIGYTLKYPIIHLSILINVILAIVLFIIGYQLKQQGIALHQIIANKLGIYIAAVIVVSSLIAGLFAALLLPLTTKEALMLSSGYGWYSLSGILAGKFLNQQMGTACFFIDFLRELFAIILIPLLGRKFPLPMIAYGGATSMDFTLPVIQVNLGEVFIPIAITSGMILTLVVPVIIPLLSLI